MSTVTTNCKHCSSVISAQASVCPHCGLSQKPSLSKALGQSIPLIASTVSTLLLVGALIWPLIFPERARIVVETASPAYALNELRMDIANLSDLAVLLPSEMFCDFRGDADYLNSRFSTVSIFPDGTAYSVLVLSRTADSAVGLRNQSARVRYAANSDDTWATTGTRGRLNCTLRLSDVHGDLDPVTPQVAFEVNDGGIILYDIGNFVNAETMDINPATFFGPRGELLNY